MKTISAELDAHLAGENTSLATCWRVTRTDSVLFAATDHDKDIVFGGVTYLAASGYSTTDVQTSSELNVDNLDVAGFLTSPSITELDLRAGLWDFAAIEIFQVNFEDLTQGSISVRSGTIGQVTIERGQFKAELRGKMQAYTRTIGRLDTPGCPWTFGDSRCKKDLTDLTVTGAITGVNSDGVTLYDDGRTEPGPTGGIAITNITNANPGVVTMASAGDFFEREPVQLDGIVGPSLLNLTTVIRNLSGSTFELGIDTSDTGIYPAYISGGTVTPVGEDSGYFGNGKITFTSGLNAGRSQDVRFYTTGQWTLGLPMPYAVQIGDTYEMVAGCNKSLDACKDFDNVINKGGFDYLPGVDKIVQVGRHS